MKKLLAIPFLFFGSVMALQAQEKSSGMPAPFVKNTATLGFSLGFGVNSYGWMNGAGVSHSPAFGFIYDHGVADAGPGTIGAGGIIGFKTTSFSGSGGGNGHFNTLIIGARGTYHLNLLKDKNNKFDPYGGIVIGVRVFNYVGDWAGWKPAGGSQAFAGLFVGARYKFTDRFGAFAELGYDISLLRLGVSLEL